MTERMDESLRKAAEIREQLSDRRHSDSTKLHFEELLSAALELPPEQRAKLARRLRQKQEPEDRDGAIRPSRLNIFLCDFREAHDFATYILTRDLHKFTAPESKKRLIHLAFNMSLIVAYCRPFHGSNDVKGRPKVSLSKRDAVAVLDTEEADFHKTIIAQRDQAFAHSDSIASEIEGWDYSGQIVMLYKSARQPLIREETQRVKCLTKKWINHVLQLRESARHNVNQDAVETVN